MTFQIGDKVVYPNQGVGTIENISTRSFGSAFERFYLLRFGCNSMTVLVPFSNAANIGLRRVTKDREIARVLSYLSNGNCVCSSDWKVRYKENTEKMQSGDLLLAAEVFKNLVQIHGDKPLSFREKKMLGSRQAYARVGNLDFARDSRNFGNERIAARAGESRVDAAGEPIGRGFQCRCCGRTSRAPIGSPRSSARPARPEG